MAPADELVLATRNRGKLRELIPLLRRMLGPGPRLIPVADLPAVPEIEETHPTFAANAVAKARQAARASGRLALAEDSGLVVDALGGRPGVLSARYAPTPEAALARVLSELGGVAPALRTARFVCVAALADPSGRCATREGRLEGVIAEAPRGERGFGYDPIFLARDLGPKAGEPAPGKPTPPPATLAELTEAEKNRISHRGRALQALGPALVASVAAGRTIDPDQPSTNMD